MIPSIPIPVPIPIPSRGAEAGSANDLNHRDTEAPSHRTVASAKTRRHEAVTKTSQIGPSQSTESGCRRRDGKRFGIGFWAHPEGCTCREYVSLKKIVGRSFRARLRNHKGSVLHDF